ncbi:hypothetical protein C8Q80DRAFT_938097 [Daedaleopsis nitida]|nr:hypothetical protein C8Q80DRAFT_938097 [Daedaleopsis nitida]
MMPTIHAQDFQEVPGDRTSGQSTLPVIHSSSPAISGARIVRHPSLSSRFKLGRSLGGGSTPVTPVQPRKTVQNVQRAFELVEALVQILH